MGRALARQPLTAAEFLAWDAHEPLRHEYFRGEVFLMAGGEDRNATVQGNIYMALRHHLRGSPCRTYLSDVKLHIAAADGYFYPDVMVTCSAADAADRLIKREPTLVIEVLSPSTAAHDRGDTFAAYRLAPSLQEYALIDIDRRCCDVFCKRDDGLWVLHPFGPSQGLALSSVALEITPELLWAELESAAADSPTDVAVQLGQA